MPETRYNNRRAAQIENERLRVTVTVEGGHIAEILDKASGVNPLWTPPWPSIEPSTYDRARHPEYGADAESKLLAGILGHNLCMDIFGPPSKEEEAAGMTVHGEASVVPYEITAGGKELVQKTTLQEAQLRFERVIQLEAGSGLVRIAETLENLSGIDKPIGWTQHVTLGPPFIEKGVTQFRLPASRSVVYEVDFAGEHGRMTPGAEFDWPYAPLKDGGKQDLSVYTDAPVSGGLTTHLMDQSREQAFFLSYSPSSRLLFGYVWKQADFPWTAIWEENYSRSGPPWKGKGLTRGMEFGINPYAEGRRKAIERNTMFGTPCYRFIPAKSKCRVEYCAFAETAARIPDGVTWDRAKGLEFS